jgi:flagellin-like protein
MRLNKKGISPLIATVLIIGFTVALAAVIMTWGQKFTKDIQEQTEETSGSQMTCANTNEVNFEIKKVCLESGNNYKITISNDGTKKLEKMQLRFYQSEEMVKVIKDQFPEGIESLGIETKSVDATINNVKKVEAIGVIKLNGKEITCVSNVVSFGDLDESAFEACA